MGPKRDAQVVDNSGLQVKHYPDVLIRKRKIPLPHTTVHATTRACKSREYEQLGTTYSAGSSSDRMNLVVILIMLL